MTHSEERLQDIRSVVEIVHGITEPLIAWGPMLFSPKEEVPVWIKIRVFPLFFVCIRDIAEAPDIHLSKIVAKESRGEPGFFYRNVREIILQCSFASELIETFTVAEQIYLAILRDRFVHGYLSGSTRPERDIKIVEHGRVIKKRYAKAEISDACDNARSGHSDDSAALLALFVKSWPNLRTYVLAIEGLIGIDKGLEQALLIDGVIYSTRRSSYQQS